MKQFRICTIALATLAAGAGPALAHPGFGHTYGFIAGLSHPIGGLDHLLAMLSVGIWSALSSNGRSWRVWVAPAAFVGAMLVGATIGYLHLALPMVETGIALSVILLGLMIATRVELPIAVGTTVMALFAIYHGHVHGSEATGAIVAYMAGFAIATAMLHVAGIGLGMLMTRARFAAQAAGAIIAAAGVYILTS
ncbi:HupE/UreJ protein [Hyphomicrobium denitrificans 1NES1]|uniref:HupE/UreJ protein n=1 Tax=Hyphomicrobium denitrificans 1NES1 TaxID=670307 RepID=N0B545_9HYPH|nr:HupE/UreJ family protein [Hyphomicrobium denitrificans]AGK57337.1 HupE/UreJ protein [Hyphomicrobium denitrificans 1NES1]